MESTGGAGARNLPDPVLMISVRTSAQQQLPDRCRRGLVADHDAFNLDVCSALKTRGRQG